MTADAPEAVTIELRLFGGFREAVGSKSLSRSYPAPVTVADVLGELEAEVPELDGRLLDPAGGLPDTVAVVRNGRNVVHFDGVATTLADGDSVAVMPPMSGGGHDRDSHRD